MARKKADAKQAAEILKLRDAGWSDQKIIAEKGKGDIALGYLWLEENPGADPRGKPAASAAAKPARGSGSSRTPERTSALI